MRRLLALFTAFVLHAEPARFAGHWKVKFEGDPHQAPKTVGSILLDLDIQGSQVIGKVVTGTWPGEAPIADVKLEGSHLSFTATGHLGSTTGIPTLAYDVTLVGDEMHLSFRTIRNGGGPVGTGYEFHYVGMRLGPAIPESLRAPER